MDNESSGTSFYSITAEDENKRIDAFLASQVKDLTRSRSQSLIREGHVKVNDLSVKVSYRLKTGDHISLFIPPVLPWRLQPEKMDLTIVHEDSSIIVLNKPAGLVIHPAPGHKDGTLVHGLLHHCRDLSGIGGVLRPGIVHRLDKDTSGLIVVAKNDYAHGFLSDQFKKGTVNKRYFALVHGILKGEDGEIDLPISRHPKKRKEMAVMPSKGKRALTLWEKKDEIGDIFTLLSVILKTGRTHQIRIHLSHLGHPVVGDPVYGPKKNWWETHCPRAIDIASKIKRQMLHAELLGFIHPDSGIYCEFTISLPDDIEQIIKDLTSVSSLK
ncbi:MAG TPA: RluA family pseudouridine synthase [Desulfatiglandales bacterium]|nr:RluA family pseudouridine synthase [Desulfatiglandales bacterium]